MELFDTWLAGLNDGSIVPYLGPGVLDGVCNLESGEPIPADSDSLILAMNNGRPMAPKLMYEFPRAAMNMELKKGRKFITRFLNRTYAEQKWSRSPMHDLIAEIKPPLVVDINRDTQLQESYQDTPHILINGVARIGGTEYRFKIYHWDGEKYTEVAQEEVDTSLPILFKPLGTPEPESNYIASDADFVDYITELMGGFAIPSFLKEYRKDKRYLLLGMKFTRDTERMVFGDITYAAGTPRAWLLRDEPTAKEERFCKRYNVELINGQLNDFLQHAGIDLEQATEAASVGC